MRNNYIFLLLFALTTSVVSAQLVLNEVHFDPNSDPVLGDANGDETRDGTEDEFLELVNNSGSTLDISGYKIYDSTKYALLPGEDTPRHTVPASTVLSANGVYVVFSGGDVSAIDGLSGVTADTASSGTLSMTNSDEVMTITDASGTILITFDGTGLNTNDNQSLERRPAITGDFVDHISINGALFSPGVVGPTFSNQLVLNEIFARPGTTTGDANGDGDSDFIDDEFIELINNSGATMDISGYKIYDYSTYGTGVPNHVVPATTTIPDDGAFVLFGGGTPTGDFGGAVVQTCSDTEKKLSATNGGDTFFITDASDDLIFVFNSLDIAPDLEAYESYTRSPDITGDFELHRENTLVRFSPGTKADGTAFLGVVSVGSFTESNVNFYLTENNSTLRIEGELEGENTLKIYDLSGKNIYESSFNTKNNNNLSLPNIESGVYIIAITNEFYGNYSKKIIIK